MNKSTWRAIAIALGVLFVFNVIIPGGFWKVIGAVVCIWIGVTLYTNRNGRGGDEFESDEEEAGDTHTGIHHTHQSPDKREYNCVFSSTKIDLIMESELPSVIVVNCVFGSTRMRLPVDYNITFESTAAFCSVELPDRDSVMLGGGVSHYGSQDPAAPKLRIKLNCAFSSFKAVMG